MSVANDKRKSGLGDQPSVVVTKISYLTDGL